MFRFRFLTAVLMTALAVLCCAGTAKASRFLTGGFMGLNIEAKPMLTASAENPNPGFARSLGFRLSPQWRIVAETSYTESAAKGGGEEQSRLSMMNLYYDFNVTGRLKPFISIGAGIVNQDTYRHGINNFSTSSESHTGLAMQTGAGMNYQLDDNTSLSGGYRHTGSASFEKDGYQLDRSGHELRLGLRYKFPLPKAKHSIDAAE